MSVDKLKLVNTNRCTYNVVKWRL